MTFQHYYCVLKSLIFLLLLDTNLENEDLGLANEALALVSFEVFHDLLCLDHPVIGVDLVIFSVAHEHQQEAVHLRVVFHCRWWRVIMFISMIDSIMLISVPIPVLATLTLKYYTSVKCARFQLYVYVNGNVDLQN